MDLRNDEELTNTREKLRLLEEHYAERLRAPVEDQHVRELSLHSLRRTINQLKEEIIRYETRAGAPARHPS